MRINLMLGGLNPSATVTAGASFGGIEFGGNFPYYSFILGDNHLGDAFSVLDLEGFLSVIDEQHFDFAPVIRVDGSWTVQDGDSVF